MCLPRVVVPPPHLMPVTGRCNLYKKVWRETLKLSACHLTALQAMPIEWTSPLECNLPFDPATRYAVRSKERLACSATLVHYLKTGHYSKIGSWRSYHRRPPTFFPMPKKGTDKMRGCVDLCKPNSCLVRGFQNRRATYYLAAHSPQRLGHQGGSEGLLHALPDRPCRSQVHAVHVGGVVARGRRVPQGTMLHFTVKNHKRKL